ncbi:hypothetical protein BGZ61DRAFT_455347 [Ilyonectria robusta]|uniref:uncharacterized protein n=1 Tax=Ilyonectria robusta TaxID=1079257 RepID=UPI001E8D975D|nr:uncharacterized protein BGZ61DRAFT_455347 [Ilyonectria robusta]KAH8683847.1 hypothetical protein BGZ61DRAFT_455347 [Ilyonectria robusta]
MAEASNRPEPAVLKRKGFQVCHGTFSVSGVDRVEGSRLKQLFYPETLRLKRDQKAARESAKELFKKDFFVAQLKHYGIEFASTAKVSQLRDLLEVAVREDRCERVPAAVLLLEKSMRRDYEPLQQAWERDVRAYDAKKKYQDDDKFAKCTTPGQRASLDLNRFIEYYFLTDGQPDQAKTTKPLAVHGFGDRASLHRIAERVDGLHTVSGGTGMDRTLCIGWHLGAVRSLAEGISAEAAKIRKQQQDSKWENAMEAHRQYVKQSQAPSFDLQRCRGSYIVQCLPVSNGWSETRDITFTLDVCRGTKGTLIADFQFGIIEGTMLLGLSDEVLDNIAEPESHSDDCGSPDDDDDEEEPDQDQKGKGKKRLAKAVSNEKARGAGHDAKRGKMMPSLSRRVYYRLRGRETGEGQILPDIESGHLDFMSDRCARFEGLADYFPYVGRNVEFRGFKVSDKPRKKAADWDAFSYQAYEYARKARWF